MNEKAMEIASKLAIEQATAMLAGHARTLAKSEIVGHLSGKQALELFADTILQLNAKLYPVQQEVKQ
jgi:hypothetical protein